jgi:hypothetical protein
MIWLVPPQHLTLDIETMAGDPCEAEAALRRSFSPNPSWKPATIGERYLQALADKQSKLALLDTSPILSVALRTESDCRLLHWMPLDADEVSGVPLERFQDERAMLAKAAEYLAILGPESVLVGHNLRHFDLPRLRLAMVRQRITLPPCLACIDHPTYDTMTLWRYFTLEERPFVSLDQCLELAGLASHKSAISGQDVGRLIDSQQWRTIAAYAIADVLAQDMLYLVMTGQIAAPDPPPEAATLQPAASAGAAQSQPVEPHVVDDTATTDQEQEAIGHSIAALLIKYGITTTTKTVENQA